MISTGWRAEISRKVLHLGSAVIPLIYVGTPRAVMIPLLAGCVVVAVAVEWLRFTNEPFQRAFRNTVGFMVRSAEWRKVCGATYVLLGAFLCVALFSKPTAIAAMLTLSCADTAASLIGIRFGRIRLGPKTLEGSAAFLVTALAVSLLVVPPWQALVVAVVGTIAEALPPWKLGPLELNDNVTVPLLAGAACELASAWL